MVVTDHVNHKTLLTKLDPSPRIARWLITIMDYKFKIVYRPGKLHEDADEVSRHAIYPPEELDPTEMLTMLAVDDKRGQDAEKAISTLIESDPPFDIRVEQNGDGKLGDILNKLAKYAVVKCILYRIVKTRCGNKFLTGIPKSMRKDIMYVAHDDPLAGHFGYRKTLDKIRLRYYWPKMSKY